MNNRCSLILNVSSLEDIENIPKNTKYINLDISNYNKEIITFFKKQGQNYFYTDSNKNGYIYVDYETFIKGESLIDSIISSIPQDLTKLEVAKYLYISLGKKIGYDINIIPEKNDSFNFYNLNKINNIWGSICNSTGTNISICKLYAYLCNIANIDNQVITINDIGYKKNKLVIDNNTFIVDLTRDIPFIESEYQTRFFGDFNDNIDLDKKIGYIYNNYVDKELDNKLPKIDYQSDDFVWDILTISQNILNITNIKPIELGLIYEDIFNKYCPNQNIIINNLYIKGNMHKEHFILISHNNKHYSYNYNRSKFMLVNDEDIITNLNTGKIGLYSHENIPNISLMEKNRTLK